MIIEKEPAGYSAAQDGADEIATNFEYELSSIYGRSRAMVYCYS